MTTVIVTATESILAIDLGKYKSDAGAGGPAQRDVRDFSQPLLFGHGRSLLAQKQIKNPASSNMRSWSSALIEDGLVVTASVRQCVHKDRQVAEAAFIVNDLS